MIGDNNEYLPEININRYRARKYTYIENESVKLEDNGAKRVYLFQYFIYLFYYHTPLVKSCIVLFIQSSKEELERCVFYLEK